jgi:hypothetical protein
MKEVCVKPSYACLAPPSAAAVGCVSYWQTGPQSVGEGVGATRP